MLSNNKIIKFFFNSVLSLAGVAQWIEHWPVNQGVAGSVPSWGACLGCRLGPQVGGRGSVRRNHALMSLSLKRNLKILY